MKSYRNNTGQKAALVGLLFLGVSALGLGFFKVRSQIFGPFEQQISRAQNIQLEQFFEEQEKQEDVQALQGRDTDGDGLSDYDELYVNKTSPYLKDTDSDTYDDATEIKNGHDPNCATGKICAPVASTTPETVSGSVSSSESVSDTVSALEQDLKKLESLNPAQVRDLLKQKGFTDTDLEGVDDVTLIGLYRESLHKAVEIEKQKQARKTENPLAPIGQIQDSQQAFIQQVVSMSKEEIIQLLGQTGELTQDQLIQLKQLQEAQLQQLLLQAVQNAQTNLDAKQP